MTDINTAVLVEVPAGLNGKQINIPNTAVNAGTAVALYTATNDPDYWDSITIECTNLGAGALFCKLQWGGNTTADAMSQPVPAGTTVIVVDRRRLRGGLTVTGLESTGSGSLNVHVQVERYKEPRQSNAA